MITEHQNICFLILFFSDKTHKIEDLKAGAEYEYRITSVASNGKTSETKRGKFTTGWLTTNNKNRFGLNVRFTYLFH